MINVLLDLYTETTSSYYFQNRRFVFNISLLSTFIFKKLEDDFYCVAERLRI